MYYLSTNKTLTKKQCKKWLSSKGCHFVKKYFYGIKLLHANVQWVYIVYTKYQDVSVNAVEQVEFPVYALPMQQGNHSIRIHFIDINLSAKFDEFPSLPFQDIKEPENHWSCIPHLSAEDMLKSDVIEKRSLNIALG